MKQFTWKKNFLVACSTGPDSFALLDIMRKNYTHVQALYIKHNARVHEQELEIKVLEKYCKKYNVPLHIQIISSHTKKTETKMRKERHAIFKQIAHELNAYIVLAHHRDDAVETFLFRLSRGTGLIGAQAFSFTTQSSRRSGEILYLRPFYNISRTDIISYCVSAKLPYSLDQTNYSEFHDRNVIRHHIIPKLETINAKTKEHIYSFITLQRKYIEYVNRHYKKLI